MGTQKTGGKKVCCVSVIKNSSKLTGSKPFLLRLFMLFSTMHFPTLRAANVRVPCLVTSDQNVHKIYEFKLVCVLGANTSLTE